MDVSSLRLGELFLRYGVATIIACFERLLKTSELQMRAALKTIRPGVYTGEDWVDDDGHDDVRVPIRVAVTVRGDRATFDFTGTGATVKGPINTTPFVAASAVYYSVKSLVGPAVPANDGAYRPIAVEVPPDTILNPPPGAPVVGGNHETSQRVVDACYKALAAAIKPIYAATSAEAAQAELDAFEQGTWGQKFPTVVAAWRRAWDRVIPFFAFPPAVRRVIYTTNAIESINSQLRKIIKSRGHFPSDDAANKLIWLALRNITADWGRAAHNWKEAMNQFAVLYAERFTRTLA